MDAFRPTSRAAAAPSSWVSLRRVLSAALLFALLATRVVVADDHAHLFDPSSGERCAACLVGSNPVDGAVELAVIGAPRSVEFVSSPRSAGSPPVVRGWSLPLACGPPAVPSSAADSRS